MDRKKREQLILLAVVLVFIAMLPNMLFKKKPRAEQYQQPPEENIDSAFEDATATPAAEFILSDSEGLRTSLASPADVDAPDPFDLPTDLQEKLVIDDSAPEEKTLAARQEESLQNIEISGLVWGSDSPTAFISDKAYKIGDLVNDAKILDINKIGVYFLHKNKKILVRMKKDENKN